MKAKYIIVNELHVELPIVFNPIMDHGNVAAIGMKVVSAGFCRRKADGSFSVWGKSVSLNIGSRPEDAEILQTRLEYDI